MKKEAPAMHATHIKVVLTGILLAGCAGLAQAHHSYEDYIREERYEFSGVITEVHWGNPHILLTVSSGTENMRIEWITTAGADKTGVAREQLAVGESLTVIGSRNRDPDTHVMTLVKELAMPASAWRWISPSLPSIR